MKYRAFGDFRKGYAHVRNGSGVEDYASSYNDSEGCFHVAVICDGHSDKNCFRSAKGAQFGCESAVEILKRFFELYLSQNAECRTLPEGFENRLKKSIKLCWDKKVYNDIEENPLKEAELSPLSERVRKIYEAGNGLLNIYGATFLAIGVCEDFFIALQIGDGAILCVDEDGTYFSPVPYDSKSDTGGPASICDGDLFSRKNAFRIAILKKLPQIATVSSDGIEDSMDALGYKRFTCSLFKKMQMEEEEDQASDELNARQKKYFESCLEYYADKGHGAEDDCSLAAIYDLTRPVPDVRLPHEEACKLWEQAMRERNELVRDYEERKKKLIESMKQVYGSPAFRGGKKVNVEQWMESHEKFEEQKRILKTIVANEKDKIAFYEKQLAFYSQYIDDFSEEKSAQKRVMPEEVAEFFVESDDKFFELKNVRQEYVKKANTVKQIKKDLEDADIVDDEAYDKAYQEYEEAKNLYDQVKREYFEDKKKTSADTHHINKESDVSVDNTAENATDNQKVSDTHMDNQVDEDIDLQMKGAKKKSKRLHIEIDIPWFK